MKLKRMLLHTAPVALAGFIYLGGVSGVGEVFAKTITTMTKVATSFNDSVSETRIYQTTADRFTSDGYLYSGGYVGQPSNPGDSWYRNYYVYVIETLTETQTEVPDDVVISAKITPSQAPHTHSFAWTVTKEPTKTEDGLEEYRCKECGAVQASQPISMYMFRVKELYGLVKDAPQGGSVTYDFGDLVTFSDYLLTKLADRSDVTVTVRFTNGGKVHSLTFPAGTDYTSVLTDADQLYGFYGLAARLGLTVA